MSTFLLAQAVQYTQGDTPWYTVVLSWFIPLLALAAVVFWFWMLFDCATREASQSNEKRVWVLIIIFTSLIGAIVYFVARRPKRKAELGR